MATRTRRNHSPAFKAKVALEAMREQETVAEIARRYKSPHANVVAKWKRQLAENVERVFEPGEEPRRGSSGRANCSRRSAS